MANIASAQQCTLAVDLSAADDGVICSGASVVLTATASSGTAPYTYIWSTGETTSSISVNKAGTYTVSVSDATPGCQPLTRSITVVAGTQPDAPLAADAVVCNNNAVTLTATSPGGDYQWYDAPLGGNFLAAGAWYTTPPITKKTIFYVQTTLNGCTSPRTAVTVSLSGTPHTADAQVCAGNTATLFASGGDAYTWYDAPGGNVVGTGPSFTTPPLTTTTTYYVIAVIGQCASDAIPVTANVTPYPQAPGVNNVTICTGSAANLHAGGGGIIDWFDTPTGGISLITSPDYTTPPLTATTTYYVQSISNGCASQRMPVVVTVNPIPDAPIVQPATVCSGTGALLTASSTAGSTYNWYADAAGTTLLFTGTEFNTPALTTNTTYYVQTVNGGCVSTSLTPLQVTVTAKPPAPVAAAATVCPNTPATLVATGPGGDYAWYDAPTGGNLLAAGPSFTTPPLTAAVTYYVQATVNGCISTRTPVQALLFAPATPPTANNASVCAGSQATLIASGADNYEWYDAASGGTMLASGKTFITPALTSPATYYVQTIVNGCASARASVTVNVNPIPSQPVVSGSTTICPGSTTTLTATTQPGGTVKWYNEGGSLLATGNTLTTPVAYETTNYYAQNVLGECSSPRTKVTVNTVAVNYPQFEYISGTFCKSSDNPVPIIHDPTGGTFSAAPAGLVFVDIHTGEVNIAASAVKSYTITFTGNESCHAVTQQTLYITTNPIATFSYAGPFCQYGSTNPGPHFPSLSGAGIFSATPVGLIFTDNTSGIIDLKKSKPGTYTVTNTIPATGTCPASMAMATVTVNPGVEVYAGPDQTVNAGATVQLAATITGVTGLKWSGGTGTFSDLHNKDAIYTPGPGETTAVLTITTDAPASACGAKADQVKITIVPKPAAPTAANVTVCAGNAATLFATAPGGNYTWYDAASGGTALASGAGFTTPALTANTTYYVQTTVSGNTSNRTAVTVTVKPLPVAPVAAPVQTCYNAHAILTASGSTGSYQWFDAPSGGNLLATGSSFTTPAMVANTSFYVQAVNNGCPGPRTRVDVTLTAGPSITSAATGNICSGSPLHYVITANTSDASFTWGRPQVSGISNAAVASHAAGSINEILINTGTSAVNVTYNITATGGGCTTTFAYVVTVYPATTITSPASMQVCSSGSINYDVTFDHAPTSFSWSRAAVPGISNLPVSGQAATSIRETLFNTNNAAIDVTYVFTYAQGNCTGTFNFVATVNPAVIVNSAPVVGACNNQPFVYTITSNVDAATFHWRRDAVAGISNAAATGNSAIINETLINTTNAPVNVLYIITPTNNGCQWPDVGLSVNVYPTPPAATANSDSPVCQGSDIHLQTPKVTGAGYLWTGPNGFTSADQNPVISNVTQANAGVYSLSLVINGCAGPAANTTVKVNSPDLVDAGDDQTVCVLQNTITLNGKVNGSTNTGIWTTSGSGTFSPSANILNAQYKPSAQDKANGTVILTLTSTSPDNCAVAADNVTITIAPTPAVGAGADRSVCTQDKAIQLAGSSIKPGPVLWSTSGSGTFSPTATEVDPLYLPSVDDISKGMVKLTLKYVNAGLCDIPTDDMIIRFVPPPAVDAGGMKYLLKGNHITLYPKVSDPDVTYLWSPNINISNTTVKNPVITGGNTDQVYTLTVTDSRGCVSTDQVLIKISPVITVNNTFTPNGDGVNDLWTITGLIAYVNATVDIFDRAGARVYHSTGYDHAWDGTYNGVSLPSGTYYYIIRLNVDGKVLSGPVTIIR